MYAALPPRPRGNRRVSGRDDGLQADADGGLLPESGDRAALPRGDRGPLLGPPPQGPHAALPDEGRPGGRRRHRRQLPEGGKLGAVTVYQGGGEKVLLCSTSAERNRFL